MRFKKTILLPLIILFLSFSPSSYSFSANNNNIANDCKNCTYASESCNVNSSAATTSAGTKTLIFIGLIVLATLYSWKQYKKKLFLFAGVVAVAAIGGSYFYAFSHKTTSAPSAVSCKLDTSTTISHADKKLINNEFKSVSSDEFIQADSSNKFEPVSSE